MLWKIRNMVIFFGIACSSSYVIREVMRLFHDIFSFHLLCAMEKHRPMLQTLGLSRVQWLKKTIQLLSWHPPTPPRLKLNVDATDFRPFTCGNSYS